MNADFAADWERLGKLAFRRQEKTGNLLKKIHNLLKSKTHQKNYGWLSIIRSWLFVPFTLWPVDFASLGNYVCNRLHSEKSLSKRTIYILERLEKLPSEEAQSAIADYERLVQFGDYDPLIRAKEKYATKEKELLADRKLKSEWAKLKQLFPIDKFRDRKGILRRSMAQERNFRPDWGSPWKTPNQHFQAAFDAFCFRWNLYGMEREKPLLLKLSMNPTAHGLMIVIPTYWSLDSKRDLDWRGINKLHKARGALRQGPKMSEGRLERHEQARKAFRASIVARKLKLKGKFRSEFIAGQSSIPLNTDPRIIHRLIREGAQL